MRVKSLPSGRYGVSVERDGDRQVVVLRELGPDGYARKDGLTKRWDAALLAQRIKPGARLALGFAPVRNLERGDVAALVEHVRRALR